MATINVRVPFEEKPLKVIWENRKVKVKGSKFALLYWKSLLSAGMHGMFGHSVDFQNTELSDVLVALQNRVRNEDIILDDDVLKIIEREAEEREPFPEGVVS